MPDNNLPNKFQDQNNLSSEQLFKLIYGENNPMNLTPEKEKLFLDKIFEFSKFFNSMKTEIYKNKKLSEEKARNHYE